MTCKQCGQVHPPDQIANPHYCLARLQERVEKMEEAAKNLDHYIVENPAKILEIPDEIYVPFMDAFGIGW